MNALHFSSIHEAASDWRDFLWLGFWHHFLIPSTRTVILCEMNEFSAAVVIVTFVSNMW